MPDSESANLFDAFFHGPAMDCLLRMVDLALDEDGEDVTSRALFAPDERLAVRILAKERAIVAGLPMTALVCGRVSPGSCRVWLDATDGDEVEPGRTVARIEGPVLVVLKAERVVMNLICQLSGIATLTHRYVAALRGSRTRLLDTRKTHPGMRYPAKYAVRVGGGLSHRMGLWDMVMLKDNHIDRAGSITAAVSKVRSGLASCPPVEVECRTLDEVREAVAAGVDRIMLDNMDLETMARALAIVPAAIETEASGSVSLENIADIGRIGPDYVSVGRITHSAPAADFSMLIDRGQSHGR